MKKKKLTHGKKKPTSHRFHIVMPDEVFKALRHEAVDQGCSVAWILTELAMEHLGIDETDLKGDSPPKYFKDRKGDWTKNKGSEQPTKEEYRQYYETTCQGCGKDYTASLGLSKQRGGDYCSSDCAENNTET